MLIQTKNNEILLNRFYTEILLQIHVFHLLREAVPLVNQSSLEMQDWWKCGNLASIHAPI